MDIIRIHGVTKNYDWGTKGYLSSLLGIENDGKCQAEYWMGTHPSGEAVTDDGKPLSSVSGKLSFLFKVLSISSPLSLQCHPDKAQAEEGWKREEEKRKKREDHNYQDSNEKAEMLSAITAVTALCGFRTPGEIISSLSSSIPLSYEKHFAHLDSIKDIFLSAFSLSPSSRNEVLSELADTVFSSPLPSEEGEYLTEYGIVRETLSKYPGDIGSLFPLMMNVVRLKPFEGIYLAPDTLHAYIRGNGVELMTASDNVLRCGLTSKRVDVAELERIMNFSSTAASPVDEYEKDRVIWYVTPSPDFLLGYVHRSKADVKLIRPAILLSLGSSSVNGEKLSNGECRYVKGSEETMHIVTTGTLYIATGGRD